MDTIPQFASKRRKKHTEAPASTAPVKSEETVVKLNADAPAPQKEPEQEPVAQTSRPDVATPAKEALDCPVAPTISVEAIAYAKNVVEASKQKGDYTYESVSDVLRASINALMNGMKPTKPKKPGKRKRSTVLLTASDHARYEEYFASIRSKGELIERALLTFLSNGMTE